MKQKDWMQLLSQECGLVRAKAVLVGVSGGADSLCLAEKLVESGYNVIIAHFNHQLRGNSTDDEAVVTNFAHSRNIPLVIGCGDVAAAAAREKKTIEEAARFMRYRFLFETAHSARAQAVAVGHTADDQVETVLMHLLRGSGLAGLRGMSFSALPNEWSQEIALVRPLLACWHTETEQYCLEHGVHPIIDPTNADPAFTRNRLRLELIPDLQTYNPKVKERLWAMAHGLTDDYALIRAVGDRAWDEVKPGEGPGWISIDLPSFLALARGLQRDVVRQGIARLRGGLADVDFDLTAQVLEFAVSPSRSRSSQLGLELWLYIEGARLYILKPDARLDLSPWPQLEPDQEERLSLPGELLLQHGWRITTAFGTDLDVGTENFSPEDAYLDADLLEFPLVVRAARTGERFEPFGMDGHSQKLADFWTNMHIPRRVRKNWPVVCSGGRIIWVPGFRPAHFCRLQPSTQKVLHLKLIPPK